MAKRHPKTHMCVHCATLILNLHLTPLTGAVNVELWEGFADPDDVQKVRESPELKKHLLTQLQSFVLFERTNAHEILERANDGCAFWQYIHNQISPTLAMLQEGRYNIEPMDIYNRFAGYHRQCDGPMEPHEERIFFFVEPQTGGNASTFRFRWFVAPYRPFHALHLQAPPSRHACHVSDDWVNIDPFQVVAEVSSEFGPHVPRPIDYTPGSTESLEFAKHWLRKILERDSESIGEMLEEDFGLIKATARHVATPSRLLKIIVDPDGSPSKLCLVETKPLAERVPYAALSYCWGGPQKTQLETETATELRTGISVEFLPNTLKDAALMSAHLGLSYIWIDAMCIIQDDPQDKSKELAKMAGFYENATVTIVASRAKSVNEGFLQERLPFKDTSEMCFSFHGIEPPPSSLAGPGDIKAKRVYVFPVADLVDYTSPDPRLPEADASGIPPNPLISRAWTFQERALSRRVIEVGRYATTHRFVDLRTGEAEITGDGWKPDPSDELPSLTLGMKEAGTMAIDQWQVIMTRFSTMALSFTSDRLPAISAFAQFFSPAFGGPESYAAGIWKSTLPFGLLWQSNTNEGETLDGPPEKHITAPSWSWAGLNSTFSYPFKLSEEIMRADQDAEILECRVQLKSPEVKFGEVLGGLLRIRGRLRPVRLSLEESVDIGVPFDDVTRSQSQRQHTRLILNYDDRFAEARGLHRRDDSHATKKYGNRGLLIIVTTDRQHAATEAIIGDCSGLFALPLVSGPDGEPGYLGTEASSSLETYGWRARHGLLLLKQSDNEYVRVAHFRTMKFDLVRIMKDTQLDEADAIALFQEQDTWMGTGEIQDFSIL